MICTEIFNDPVTTTCICSSTTCKKCFTNNQSKCIICRKTTQANPNAHIKNLLANQKIVCKCGKKYIYNMKEEHDIECNLSIFACPTCKNNYNGPEFMNHLIKAHYLQVMAFGSGFS